MTELDRQIEEALDAEDRVLAKELEELGLFGQFKSLFQGKLAWVSASSMIFGTILNIAFFFAAWKFLSIPDIDSRIFWGAIGWFTAMMVAFMKVWFWMRMESNRVLRELKRVELQLARLQRK